jgi:hypothetical protein
MPPAEADLRGQSGAGGRRDHRDADLAGAGAAVPPSSHEFSRHQPVNRTVLPLLPDPAMAERDRGKRVERPGCGVSTGWSCGPSRRQGAAGRPGRRDPAAQTPIYLGRMAIWVGKACAEPGSVDWARRHRPGSAGRLAAGCRMGPPGQERPRPRPRNRGRLRQWRISISSPVVRMHAAPGRDLRRSRPG